MPPVSLRGRRLLIATVVAGTMLSASPARAEVTFDFAAHTGHAGATELRQAFGWDAAALRSRAAGLTFTRNTLVQDVYSVVCGPAGTRPLRAVHARESGTYFLTSAVDRDPRGEVRGLRITGADAAISGTTVPPTPGLPCPGTDDDPSRSTVARPGPGPRPGNIRTATLMSTTTTLTLIVRSGDVTRELAELRTGPEIPN